MQATIERPVRHPLVDAAWRLKRDKLALVGLALIAVLIVVALLAPVLAPFDPNQQFADGTTTYGNPLAPSVLPEAWRQGQEINPKYLLGTDNDGRDVLSRLVYGTRISLLVGVVGVGFALGLGLLFGLVAGYFGGWVDTTIMRLTDIMMSVPELLLVMAIVAIRGPSLINILFAIGLVSWTSYARVVRGQVLSLREMEYVEAARAVGAGAPRILVHHLLPNIVAPVIVLATMGMASAIMTEAALSFLGLGVKPPTASWGAMIRQVVDYFQVLPAAPLIPGLAIAMTVFAFNLFGDGLRDALDPRLK